MSLEQIVTQVCDFITNTPLRATLDIGGHALAGSFLVQRYFPEVPKSMKATLGLVGGFAPDFDFMTLGVIAHRTHTHTGAFAAVLASWMLYFNQEDWQKYHGKNLLENSINDVKRVVASRYTKLATLGVTLHLGMDALNSETERLCYCLVVGGALVLQNQVNKKQNRTQQKETFRMHPCIVIDANNKKYIVGENFHSRCAEEFLEAEKRYSELYGMPSPDLPAYNLPTYEFGDTEVVREHQKMATRDAKTIFQRIDERIDKIYGRLRQVKLKAPAYK